VAYEYDGNNRLIAVDIPSVGRVTVNSYRWNRPDKVTLPGGSQINFSYDALMLTVRSFLDRLYKIVF